MPLKLGYRGSLIWSVTETTAGSGASMVSEWESPSRRARELAAVELQRRREGHLRKTQALGQLCRDQGGLAVGGGHAGDDQVRGGLRAEVPDRRGQCQRRCCGVRAGQGVVAEVHAFRGADLQGFLHGVDCTGRAHAQGDDLVAGRFPAAGLDQLQRRFQGVFIQFGQDALGAVRGVALAGEMAVELRIRDVLDQHNDFQSLFHCVYSSLPCGWIAAPGGVMATERPVAGLFLANHIAAGRRGLG